MSKEEDIKDIELIKWNELKKIIPISRAALLVFEKRGDFPKRIKIGRDNYWRVKEIKQFVEDLVDKHGD